MKKDFRINFSRYHFMDNDNFYKVIRLKTGESIICTMQQDIQSSATETQKRLEISNAVIEFLREVTPGEVRIIDIDNHGEQYGEDEEG